MKSFCSLLLMLLVTYSVLAQEKVSTRFFNPNPVSYLSKRNFGFVPDSIRQLNEVKNRKRSSLSKSSPVNIQATISASAKSGGVPDLPYPILFVHGLTGNLQTWSTMTNFLSPALGPSLNLNFCLNSDANNGYAFHGTDITSFIPNNLQSANVYKANFYCSVAGNCANATTTSAMYSHQAGIFKQGKAIGLAIQAIINATGKDKVVLVGHSMGGLAIREYMQNQLHWFDTEHHIAKLVTVGTPHAGSDFELAGFAVLGELFQDVDTDSEAVRDLRSQTDGTFEWNPGVFLWGGLED